MRLIDADALIDEVKHITGQDTIMWFYDRRIKREQEVNMAAFIGLMPTIDPVKRGRWELHEYPDGYYHTECSECGAVYDEKVYFRKTAHYCPNCGASMDGGEDDEPV